jgi:hypothetical protein
LYINDCLYNSREDSNVSIKSVVVALTTVVLLLSGSCEDGNNPTQQSGNKKAFGVFSIVMDQDQNSVSFLGTLKNGSEPAIRWDTVMTSGECRLLKVKSDRVCEGCGTGYTCVDKNDCQRQPDTLTAGTVTVGGYINRVGVKATASPTTIYNGNYQLTLENRLANPPFTEGGNITITASGNELVSGFTLTAKTISKLEVSSDSIPMDPGKDIHLTWKAAANPADSRITVVIDIAYHGAALAKIVCDCADDGDLVIPGDMLDKLKTYGLAGHPKVEVYRTSIGTNPTTEAKIVIQATLKLWLKIPGLVSCSRDGEVSNCGEGFICEDQHCVEVK